MRNVLDRGFKSSQLLHDPFGVWMRRDSETNNSPSLVTDDEEDIEHTEHCGWYGEKIDPGKHIAVVTKK